MKTKEELENNLTDEEKQKLAEGKEAIKSLLVVIVSAFIIFYLKALVVLQFWNEYIIVEFKDFNPLTFIQCCAVVGVIAFFQFLNFEKFKKTFFKKPKKRTAKEELKLRGTYILILLIMLGLFWIAS